MRISDWSSDVCSSDLDLSPVSAAAATGDGPAIVQAATDAWQGVKATNFPERAGVLANEIENSEPLLVGLQEVSLFRTGPPDSITATPTPALHVKSEERRAGTGCVSTCKYRLSP